jgi:hypothetical protein
MPLSFCVVGSWKVRPIRRLIAKKRVFRIGHRLALGRLADQTFAVVRERDHRGRRAGAFGVLDHLGRLAVHDGDAGIRGAKVDTDYLRHVHSPLRASHPGPLEEAFRQGQPPEF